jgi:dTMP kinase
MTEDGGSDLSSARQALFISFEGTEGSGKTTQMGILVERLRSLGYSVVENQEPGGTSIGRQIRRVVLEPENREMAAMTELLLVFASRAQAAAEVIIPALASGNVVVSDRFTDSSLAYQGAARGLGFGKVMAAHELAVGGLLPDLTLWLKVDVEQGLARANGRNAQRSRQEQSEARIDQQPADFHRKVRDGYARIAAEEPRRFRIIDGDANVSTVAARVWHEVEPLLPQIVIQRVTQ